MRWLLLISAEVLLCFPASAQVVKFLALGDTQIYYRCPAASNPWPGFGSISTDACRTFQGNRLDALLTYAEDINVDFVWILGDHLNNADSVPQRTIIKDVLAAHPNLTYHWAIGNHDVGGVPGVAYAKHALIDEFDEATPVRRPHWETWQVGDVHFMTFNSTLWSHEAQFLYGIATDGNCTAKDDSSSGACTAGTTGVGQSTCDNDEACEDYDAYATNQMTALTAAITAKEASGGIAMFFGSHHLAWDADNADVTAVSDAYYVIHNHRQCDGGVDHGNYCNNIAGYGCTAPGTCTTNVAGEDWRSQLEAAIANLTTTAYFMTGHRHDDLNYSGTTSPNSAVYDLYTITGSAAPATDADPLTAMLVEVFDNGTPTFTRVLATWQGKEAFGVEVFGGSLP